MTRSRSLAASVRGTALVTGAADRRGAAIAVALAEDGWDLALGCPRVEDVAETSAAITAAGRRVVALRVDLRQPRGPQRLIERTAAALSPPRCLVGGTEWHRSGIRTTAPGAVDVGALAMRMQTEVAAPIVLAQAMHRLLAPRQRGVVVHVLDARRPDPGGDDLPATLSNAALRTATGWLARTLSPRLRVVGVACDPAGTPRDLAGAVTFLVNARAVTGTVLTVDGGQRLPPSARRKS